MEIENTTFGTITIDGKTYEHDVLIRLSGEVVKRKKKLSKKYYGTSHILSKDEAKFVYEQGCKQLICWLGPNGQCAPIAGSRSLFRKERLQSPVATDPRFVLHIQRRVLGRMDAFFQLLVILGWGRRERPKL